MEEFNLEKFGIDGVTAFNFDFKMDIACGELVLLTITDKDFNQIKIDYVFNVKTCRFDKPHGFYFTDTTENYLSLLLNENLALFFIDDSDEDNDNEYKSHLVFNGRNVLEVMKEFITDEKIVAQKPVMFMEWQR